MWGFSSSVYSPTSTKEFFRCCLKCFCRYKDFTQLTSLKPVQNRAQTRNYLLIYVNPYNKSENMIVTGVHDEIFSYVQRKCEWTKELRELQTTAVARTGSKVRICLNSHTCGLEHLKVPCGVLDLQ